MWEASKTSMIAFLHGKLFADQRLVIAIAGVGVAVTAALFIVAVKLGVPVLAAAPAAGFLGGMLQPRLFKNLKYK